LTGMKPGFRVVGIRRTCFERRVLDVVLAGVLLEERLRAARRFSSERRFQVPRANHGGRLAVLSTDVVNAADRCPVAE
jgi:hypothetical protein